MTDTFDSARLGRIKAQIDRGEEISAEDVEWFRDSFLALLEALKPVVQALKPVVEALREEASR